ncbi:hypothetical protein HHL22_20740 [Hymenobacter sp. RP-2-7]|uniref:Uncharacterized protein n=1 Tax=Hymenobacter polaris TaxID=2682546 RepID=A0A7Y0FPH0_9BACT|nr:hypothetical protein [Hymenobacter polaris]NML67636.1 hypothetical protein [Hymenobacter polaris]
MATRNFLTTPSPFRAQRSVLSPQAEWPAQEPAEASLPHLLTPRYSDAQRLAMCAWASADFRKLPAAEQLRVLLHYPGLNARPIYASAAWRALKSECPEKLAAALKDLLQETERLRANRLQLRRHLPNLFTAIAA